MGISIRAYARHRGVSHVAVKKAIDTGRITPEADGSLDPERADREWAENTVASRKAPATAKSAPQPAPAAQAQRPFVPSPPSEPITPSVSAGGTSLLQARTVNEVLRVQMNKVKLAKDKDELVDRAQAVAHVFSMARAEREAWLNWPARISAQMAAELGIDGHTLHLSLDAAVRELLLELGELHPRVN